MGSDCSSSRSLLTCYCYCSSVVITHYNYLVETNGYPHHIIVLTYIHKIIFCEYYLELILMGTHDIILLTNIKYFSRIKQCNLIRVFIVCYSISCIFNKYLILQGHGVKLLLTATENLSMGFLTRFYTNRAVQLQKMVRGLKFQI